jgi:hypothetical protein
MAKKKFNPELLKEELKRFRMISEYSFYHEDTSDDGETLILGTDLEEVDEDPANQGQNPGDANQNAQQSGGTPPVPPAQSNTPTPDNNQQAQGQDSTPAPEDDPENLFGADDAEAPADDMGGNDMGNDMGGDDMGMDAEAPAEDEVEVDVTQLVQNGEETKNAVSMANQKTEELLAKFTELEQKISAMDKISSKIEALEKEIVKRNPTPVEKLEMRSMNSYPYNIKLTDYWKDVDGYEATEKPKEYVLTNDDIDSFTDSSIKDTFNIEDYEEEEI